MTSLSQDSILDIMYKFDIDDLVNICSTNPMYNQLCDSNVFWINKFNHDKLPFIPLKIGLKNKIDQYKKIKNAYDVSSKLVNYLMDKKPGYFNKIQVVEDNLDIDDIDWMPSIINDAIQNSKNDANRSLEFDIKDLIITYWYVKIDKHVYSNESTIVDVHVSKEEMIHYLSKLFYYFPDIAIINEPEDNEVDVFLSYQDLLHDEEYVRIVLNQW